MKNPIIDRFNQVMKNCRFYEKQGLPNSLLNEIGVLRGIYYCMEIDGVKLDDMSELMHFIDIQQNMKEPLTRYHK